MRIWYIIVAFVALATAIVTQLTAPNDKTTLWGFLILSMIASAASTIHGAIDRLEGRRCDR